MYCRYNMPLRHHFHLFPPRYKSCCRFQDWSAAGSHNRRKKTDCTLYPIQSYGFSIHTAYTPIPYHCIPPGRLHRRSLARTDMRSAAFHRSYWFLCCHSALTLPINQIPSAPFSPIALLPLLTAPEHPCQS